MRVLGIDPAAAGPTGYGVVEADGRACRALDYGTLRHARSDSPAACLTAVHALLARLVQQFAPDAVAVESVFAALNRKSALRLAEVRGVVLLAAAQKGVPVHSYSPLEVKLSVAGYGRAGKHQVQQMVRALLGLRHPPQSPSLGTDAADALAVALCHIHTAQGRERLQAATGSLPHHAARPGRKISTAGKGSRGGRGKEPVQPEPLSPAS